MGSGASVTGFATSWAVGALIIVDVPKPVAGTGDYAGLALQEVVETGHSQACGAVGGGRAALAAALVAGHATVV